MQLQQWFLSVTLGFLALLPLTFEANANEIGLTRAVDLRADAVEAKRKGVPIVLFSNLTGCHYCRGALREVLLPMQRDAGWARTAIYRQIDVDKSTPMTNFAGEKTTHAAFARAAKLNFTPTVLVVDANGGTLAEPIVGVASWDFYGYNVEEAIRKGFDEMQKTKVTP